MSATLWREQLKQEREIKAALLDACKELTVAVAAMMRVVADVDVMKRAGAPAGDVQARFVEELHRSGVADGFGVRANAAIANAEGR